MENLSATEGNARISVFFQVECREKRIEEERRGRIKSMRKGETKKLGGCRRQWEKTLQG